MMTVDVFFSYDSVDSAVVRQIKKGIDDRTGQNVNVYIYEGAPNQEHPSRRGRKAESDDKYVPADTVANMSI